MFGTCMELGALNKLDKKYAWVAFALAVCCCVSALVYASVSNARGKGRSTAIRAPSRDAEPPRFVPIEPAAAAESETVPPATVTPTLGPAKAPTSGQWVQAYPGGWVWNPAWHQRFYWETRYDPIRWDRLGWSWWNTWWDRHGRQPWHRGPIPPSRHDRQRRRDHH